MENVLNIIMSLAVIGTFILVAIGSYYYLNKYRPSKAHIVVENLFVDRDQFNGGPDPCSHAIDTIEMLNISGIGKNLFSEK